jgi:hypothetical protein
MRQASTVNGILSSVELFLGTPEKLCLMLLLLLFFNVLSQQLQEPIICQRKCITDKNNTQVKNKELNYYY